MKIGTDIQKSLHFPTLRNTLAQAHTVTIVQVFRKTQKSTPERPKINKKNFRLAPELSPAVFHIHPGHLCGSIACALVSVDTSPRGFFGPPPSGRAGAFFPPAPGRAVCPVPAAGVLCWCWCFLYTFRGRARVCSGGRVWGRMKKKCKNIL